MKVLVFGPNGPEKFPGFNGPTSVSVEVTGEPGQKPTKRFNQESILFPDLETARGYAKERAAVMPNTEFHVMASIEVVSSEPVVSIKKAA